MSHNLSLVDAAFDTTGKYGKSFIGGYGYATPSPLPTTGTFTVEAWVKTTATDTMVAVGQQGAFWIGCVESKARAVYGTGSDEVSLVSSVTINDGNWHHVALQLGPSGGKFFVDGGAPVVSAVTSALAHAAYTAVFEVHNFYENRYPWYGAIDEVVVSSVEKYTGAFTPGAASVSQAGLVALYHLDGDGADAVAASSSGTSGLITHFPADTHLVYSGSWRVTNTAAKTINTGQYFRTLVPAGSCQLTFDLAGILAPLPQITVFVNGVSVVRTELAAAISVPLGSQAYTLVEVVVAAMTETAIRWSTQSTAVVFTGFILGSSLPLRTPNKRPLRVLVYGDSITEGVRTLAASSASGKDTDRNDATQGWALALRDYLGAEVDTVGFGATGLATGGSGGVPALGSSYAYLWAGQARDFTTSVPDLIILMEGTNDGSKDITSAYTSVLNGLLAATPASTKIMALQPFNLVQGTYIQAAVAASSVPARVQYVASAGFWATADSSDNLHPYGFANLTTIAPAVASAAKAMLAGATGTSAGTFPTPTLSKSLMGFIFKGNPMALASSAFKNNVRIIYGFNAGGTGFTSFKPASAFNSLTQLVQDGVYIVDAVTPGFQLPGAIIAIP